MTPMTNRVKALGYFQGLIIDTYNFTSEVKAELWLESTIPDGLTACRPDREASNRTSYSPVEAGT